MEQNEKDKKWESGPMQDTDDKRTDEQMQRAKEESERRKENLEDKGEGEEAEEEGSYQEKNGDTDNSYEGLKNEPKLEVRPTHPSND